MMTARSMAEKPAETYHDRMMKAADYPNEQIALLIYPGFTALDMVGPQYAFGSMIGAKVHVVARTMEIVESDTKLAFRPSATFATCPDPVDIIFVPGGTKGTLAAMEDKETIAFLKSRGEKARLVTSVCTGSLVLGAAGLLKGYKATSHWLTLDLLSEFGAIPDDRRVVVDRTRMTGAGVTAGIDFGLQIVEKLRGREYAEAVQLLAEYDPDPPLKAGNPKTAPKAARDLLTEIFAPFREDVRQAAARIAVTR
jgi:putative intracellular protease/amidase